MCVKTVPLLTVPAPAPACGPQERAWNPAPAPLPDTWKVRGLASYVPAYTCSHAPAPFQKGSRHQAGSVGRRGAGGDESPRKGSLGSSPSPQDALAPCPKAVRLLHTLPLPVSSSLLSRDLLTTHWPRPQRDVTLVPRRSPAAGSRGHRALSPGTASVDPQARGRHLLDAACCTAAAAPRTVSDLADPVFLVMRSLGSRRDTTNGPGHLSLAWRAWHIESALPDTQVPLRCHPASRRSRALGQRRSLTRWRLLLVISGTLWLVSRPT